MADQQAKPQPRQEKSWLEKNMPFQGITRDVKTVAQTLGKAGDFGKLSPSYHGENISETAEAQKANAWAKTKAAPAAVMGATAGFLNGVRRETTKELISSNINPLNGKAWIKGLAVVGAMMATGPVGMVAVAAVVYGGSVAKAVTGIAASTAKGGKNWYEGTYDRAYSNAAAKFKPQPEQEQEAPALSLEKEPAFEAQAAQQNVAEKQNNTVEASAPLQQEPVQQNRVQQEAAPLKLEEVVFYDITQTKKVHAALLTQTFASEAEAYHALATELESSPALVASQKIELAGKTLEVPALQADSAFTRLGNVAFKSATGYELSSEKLQQTQCKIAIENAYQKEGSFDYAAFEADLVSGRLDAVTAQKSELQTALNSAVKAIVQENSVAPRVAEQQIEVVQGEIVAENTVQAVKPSMEAATLEENIIDVEFEPVLEFDPAVKATVTFEELQTAVPTAAPAYAATSQNAAIAAEFKVVETPQTYDWDKDAAELAQATQGAEKNPYTIPSNGLFTAEQEDQFAAMTQQLVERVQQAAGR